MILGTGIDLTDIRRIEKILKKFGNQFEKRVFTETERNKAHSRKEAGKQVIAATYAKRFAAKEACIKALAMPAIKWHDMEITNNEVGAPVMQLHNAAQQHLERITPAGHKARLFLSLTDSYPYAQAQLIIAAEPL